MMLDPPAGCQSRNRPAATHWPRQNAPASGPAPESRRAWFHQLIRRLQGVDVAGGEFVFVDIVGHHPRAHALQQLLRGQHIAQLRHIGQPQGVGGQQAGAQNRQRRILAPDTVMSPFSGPLPTIFSFSMTSIQPLQRRRREIVAPETSVVTVWRSAQAFAPTLLASAPG